MSDNLTPAQPDDFKQSLAHGLQFDGKRRLHGADSMMAALMADHLVKHLERSGYVVMKKPPTPWHSFGSCRTTP